MHDPCTIVKCIKWPFSDAPLLTIWHRDPERDGSDDSCDWFGGKHLNRSKLEEIQKAFVYEGRDSDEMSWFANSIYGCDLYGVGLGMFRVAANIHFGHWSRRANRFLRNNVFDILHFIDNSCDSINCQLRRANDAKGKKREEILKGLATVVYAWIVRSERPWWRHPRYHIWHWRLQLHPWQNLKRRWWDKCAVCGKHGFKGTAIGNWDGDKIWHSECDKQGQVPLRKGEE